MDLEIRRLTPGLAQAYIRFFDETPHWENSNGDKCYCVSWRSDGSYAGNGDHWYPTRKERRKRALQFVKDGSIQGYLAYHGGRIVGWCNATGDCQGGINYFRSHWPIEEYRADVRVKSIFCFVIAPDMKRKGIATRLVERVCEDAAGEGFDFVEAYADKDDVNYRGPLELYIKCGFAISAEREGRVVVRKALK